MSVRVYMPGRCLTGSRPLSTRIDASPPPRRVTPAAEWLLDNFYLIEEQIRTARRHLPRGYSRELPRLAGGASAGLPRVYDIALEAISHGDGRVDARHAEPLRRGLPDGQPLQLGELWAIPIMLRLALIENLRRVARARGRRAGAIATAPATGPTRCSRSPSAIPSDLILVIADMARSDPPLTSAFVAELARRLQGQSAALALPLTWIEQRLAESGQTIEQLVQVEAQQPGGRPGVDRQQHRQPAPARRDGLARVRRDA